MRLVRTAPAFLLATVTTLALGIATVVTMVSVYWAVVMDAVRLPDPARVVSIAREQPDPLIPTSLSWPRVEAIRRATTAFAAVGAYENDPVSLSGMGPGPRDLAGLRVSAGFFDALGVVPARGRLLRAEDDLPNGPAIAVLSHEAWLGLFGGADVVGRTIRLNGRATEIVGILPPRLSAPWGDRQVFLPRVFEDSQLTPEAVSTGASYLSVVARLAPGRTIEQATRELGPISRDFARDHAGRSDTLNGIAIEPLAETVVANRRSTLTLLLGAVSLVLLVACANAGALVSSRLAGRQREIAVRRALGAGRAAIVGIVLAETLTVALLAGAAGVGLGVLAVHVAGARLAPVLPPGTLLAVGRAAIAGAALSVLGAIVLVGVVPALHATRESTASGVAVFVRGMSLDARMVKFRRVLVIGEVAVSAFLLIGAALFITSLRSALDTPVGFDPAGLAAAAVTLPSGAYPSAGSQQAFFTSVLDRLEHTPGVQGATVVFGLPFAPDNFVSPYVVAGRVVPPPAERRRAGLRIVTEGYLTVMRLRLLSGRFFTAADRSGAHPVCVVNQSFARREFGERLPIGATVLRGRNADQAFEIVGVVADVRTNGPGNPAPEELFLPFRQVPRPAGALVVRTARPDTSAAMLQSAVAGIDPDLPIAGFSTMERAMADTLGPERILAGLAAAFAIVALVLAAGGLYAVLAHSVATRRLEIGIRMAMGADPASILKLVVTGALRLVIAGLACGLCAAAAAGSLVASQLHGVGARDPAVYAAVVVAFGLVGVAASLVPAWRATRVSPTVAMAGLSP